MELKPFKAVRFNAARVGDVGACISPPYDVINDVQREELYEKSEHNIVRIIKGKTEPTDTDDNNQYTRAAGYLTDWLESGVLKEDSSEAVYGYVQDFETAGNNYRRVVELVQEHIHIYGMIH